jgi:hypothetical protein
VLLKERLANSSLLISLGTHLPDLNHTQSANPMLTPVVAAQTAVAVFTASIVLTAESQDGGDENLSMLSVYNRLSTNRFTVPSVRKFSQVGMSGTVMKSLSISHKLFGFVIPSWQNNKLQSETPVCIAAPILPLQSI